MGIFGRLLRQFRPERVKVKSEDPEIQVGVEVVAQRHPTGTDSSFATSASVVEEAIDQILADIDMPENAKVRLKSLFVKAHRSGSPRREIEAVELALDGAEWGEKYFGEWKMRFEAKGEFPYMWRTHGKALVVDSPQPPSTIEDAVGYLRVTDMRQILIELDAMPAKGRPKKRSEFIDLLSTIRKTKLVVESAIPAYRDARTKWQEDREAAKRALLAHTLTMRAYTLRDCRKRENLTRTSRLRALKSDCPVETEYAVRFMAGKNHELPPFFPGDRTSLIEELQNAS